MARTRPRPRRTKQTPKSRLAPCVYRADATMPDPGDPDHPLCVCGLAWRHPRHTLPDTGAAQAEHERRIGGDR
ncbi:hypothetical protein OOK41_09220 [Micromonospora sp. NBC_01655]|uniref:hypothetical protein n=1 Tax=Micromonospora sp. NBC_01655 TaxID=2975983 RepID=UPI00224E40E5|nr:hypothetical protein [Micromonospora sp. NBC_01655]MCX4470486.1 hypothetical protein [Micromonospora sp. NBC_01655]